MNSFIDDTSNLSDQLTSIINTIRRQKHSLILNRIQVLGLLPNTERLTKVCQGEEEIWYYDYNTDDVKFIIYFKGIEWSNDVNNDRITFSIDYF